MSPARVAKRGNGMDSIIELLITLPKEMNSGPSKDTIIFSPEDFSLSWMDFFEKYRKRPLYEFLQRKESGYIVQDFRTKHNQKRWTLQNNIKDFINSFKRIPGVYKAVITKRTPQMVVSPPPAAAPRAKNSSRAGGQVGASPIPKVADKTSPGTGKANRKLPSPTTRSDARRGNGNSPHTPHPRMAPNMRAELNLTVSSDPNSRPRARHPPTVLTSRNRFDDDAISTMSSQDSQDSQLEELIRQGVNIKPIKPIIIKNLVTHVDNVTLLKMKKELQGLIDSGRWLKITGRMPTTAGFLQLVFGVTTSGGP